MRRSADTEAAVAIIHEYQRRTGNTIHTATNEGPDGFCRLAINGEPFGPPVRDGIELEHALAFFLFGIAAALDAKPAP